MSNIISLDQKRTEKDLGKFIGSEIYNNLLKTYSKLLLTRLNRLVVELRAIEELLLNTRLDQPDRIRTLVEVRELHEYRISNLLRFTS